MRKILRKINLFSCVILAFLLILPFAFLHLNGENNEKKISTNAISLYNTSSGFDKDTIQSLFNSLKSDSGNTNISNLSDYVDSYVEKGYKGVPASELGSFYVQIGDLTFDVVFLSKDTNGNVILTLWLDSYQKGLYSNTLAELDGSIQNVQGAFFTYFDDNTDVYSNSYLRNDILYKPQFDILTNKSSKLTSYIVKPVDVDWQRKQTSISRYTAENIIEVYSSKPGGSYVEIQMDPLIIDLDYYYSNIVNSPEKLHTLPVNVTYNEFIDDENFELRTQTEIYTYYNQENGKKIFVEKDGDLTYFFTEAFFNKNKDHLKSEVMSYFSSKLWITNFCYYENSSSNKIYFKQLYGTYGWAYGTGFGGSDRDNEGYAGEIVYDEFGNEKTLYPDKNASNYNKWFEDYIWIPSVTETGIQIDKVGSSSEYLEDGIWNCKDAITIDSRLYVECNDVNRGAIYTQLRSTCGIDTDPDYPVPYSVILNRYGVPEFSTARYRTYYDSQGWAYTYFQPSKSCAVNFIARPAFHLNLTKLSGDYLIPTYDLYFYANDESEYVSDSENIQRGEKLILPTEKASDKLKKEGYKLIGWKDDLNGMTYYLGENYTVPDFGPAGTRVNFYAVWEKLKYYDIVYDGGPGATDVPASQHLEMNETAEIAPYCLKEGYLFNHWKGSDGNVYKPYQEVSQLVNTDGGSITLTAVYDETWLNHISEPEGGGNSK